MDLGAMWDGWSDDENRLFQDALGTIADDYGAQISEAVEQDGWLQFLHHEVLWDFELPADQRAQLYDSFVEYVEETYGIEWEDIYDWDAYRDAYDAA